MGGTERSYLPSLLGHLFLLFGISELFQSREGKRSNYAPLKSEARASVTAPPRWLRRGYFFNLGGYNDKRSFAPCWPHPVRGKRHGVHDNYILLGDVMEIFLHRELQKMIHELIAEKKAAMDEGTDFLVKLHKTLRKLHLMSLKYAILKKQIREEE
jgi:hypothetical protein